VYGAAMGLATKLADGAAEAFTALPFAPKVRAAVLAAAIELGTLAGHDDGRPSRPPSPRRRW
jgi:hypothetical protein